MMQSAAIVALEGAGGDGARARRGRWKKPKFRDAEREAGVQRMKITQVLGASTFQNPHAVEAKRIYDTENAEVIHMSLKPGQSLKRHITPVDVFFYILEGRGIVEIGDERQEVGRDMLIESPKGGPHLLSNPGEGVFRFLVVKVPKQKAPSKIDAP